MTNDETKGKNRSSVVFSLRYLRVLTYFGSVALSFIWWHITLRSLGLRRLSRIGAENRYRRYAIRFRRLATRLGGIWIKVGQFLSARVDVLPESITNELAGLQDEVKPEKFEALLAVVEDEFLNSEEKFVWFNETPLASASLGQVHHAKLPDDTQVVVKIQRPNIHELIQIDLAALNVVMGWLKRFKPVAKRVDLDALFTEFSRTLWEEVDYLAEAENARRFKAMFAENPSIRIPEAYDSHTSKRVLTLEDVYHIKITDYSLIEDAGIDRAEVADRLFETYLRQIFEEGFFHADPHPGNLFVEPLEDGRWRLIFVDFGMVGHLAPEVTQGMRDLAIAVATRNTDLLVGAYQTLGMILPGANLERIREAEAAVMERFWGKSMRELTSIDPREMHRFAREYRDLLYELPFQVPADLLFLGRCVAILSGMCTGLNPDFNLFEGLMPFAESILMDEEQDWAKIILDWLKEQTQFLVALPKRIDNLLLSLERGELTIRTKPGPEITQRLDRIVRGVNRIAAALVFVAFFGAGVWFYQSGDEVLGIGLLGLSIITLWWVVKK